MRCSTQHLRRNCFTKRTEPFLEASLPHRRLSSFYFANLLPRLLPLPSSSMFQIIPTLLLILFFNSPNVDAPSSVRHARYHSLSCLLGYPQLLSQYVLVTLLYVRRAMSCPFRCVAFFDRPLYTTLLDRRTASSSPTFRRHLDLRNYKCYMPFSRCPNTYVHPHVRLSSSQRVWNLP